MGPDEGHQTGRVLRSAGDQDLRGQLSPRALGDADRALLERFAAIRRNSRSGTLAPNKPLTLRWALARVARGEPRLTPFATAERELQPLLDACGTPGTAPSYAFWRLQNDGLWEVRAGGELPARSKDKEPLLSAMRRFASGGFEASVFDRLASSAELRRLLAALLERQLDQAAPGIAAVQAPPVWQTLRRRAREAAFRHTVLAAYGARCVLCGWCLTVGGRVLGLDAAHVRPLAEGGPDSAENGLPLCTHHHALLDAGLFTWEASRRLQVASSWREEERGEMPSLLAAAGAVLADPEPPAPSLDPRHFAWHREHVFRG